MFTNAQNKYIRSLTQQKYRKEYNVFIAEGVKIANEWLKSGEDIQIILATNEWAADNNVLIEMHPNAELYIVKERELDSFSAMKTSNQVLLVVGKPKESDIRAIKDEWCIALDNISDPGNMGTIIRIADWFGIKHVICSPESVDAYNPKVIQAAMGSHLRANLYTAQLDNFLPDIAMPILAATLDGESVYTMPKLKSGVLLIGNESFGVSQTLMNMATRKVTIPAKGGAESLNAAVSAGILCALLVGGNG